VVHRRFVEAGLGDSGLEVVADNLPRHAAERGQCVDMDAAPVGQRLAVASASLKLDSRTTATKISASWVSRVAASITSMA
jgi:hypothetical protein